MKQLTSILFFIFFIAGCASNKEPYVYEVCVREPSDPSKVISNTTIGFADTTIATLSGTVFDQSLKDFIPFVSVSLQNVKTGEEYNDNTDTSGHFSLHVPAGNYNLKTEIIHSLPLQKNISLKSGEIRELKIALSEYNAIHTYRIESDKKRSKKQLKEKVGLIPDHSCTHDNLFKQFDILIERYEEAENNIRSIKIKVLNKNTSDVSQTMRIEGTNLRGETYKNCNNTQSLSNLENSKFNSSDNYYGDFVVFDFNFDQRKDIAFIHDSGGISGPHYEFYIQLKAGIFIRQDFLSDSIVYFPSKIDTLKHQITTTAHINVYQEIEKTYQYFDSSDKWSLISERIIDL